MKSDFFIDRPIFSIVISIVIVIVGVLGLFLLPIDQYPQIVPPVVKVSASYPGASAQTVTQAVATPIEQELNGTPGMLYMESTNSNSGSFSATITFDISTDPDLAAVEIQNRVKQAEARLPAEVVQNGISVEKQASSRLMTVTLRSNDPKFDEIYLSNYATLNVLDMLRRVKGVGSVSNVGSRYYAMQIWVQPDRLANLGLTVDDLHLVGVMCRIRPGQLFDRYYRSIVPTIHDYYCRFGPYFDISRTNFESRHVCFTAQTGFRKKEKQTFSLHKLMVSTRQ